VRVGWSGGVEVLLDHGASALSRTPAQDMALHWAAYRGDVDILQQLINAGGDVNAMGDVGNRPLHLAASADRMEVSCGPGTHTHSSSCCSALAGPVQ
jgi:hypothetical protein